MVNQEQVWLGSQTSNAGATCPKDEDARTGQKPLLKTRHFTKARSESQQTIQTGQFRHNNWDSIFNPTRESILL
jgi:hypothetical protein